MDTCRLCNQEKELQESHIIPNFVYRWLKETSVTGHIRSGESVNKRVQDGHKFPLLCRECEQRFSEWENIFARGVFVPIHSDNPTNTYRKWLIKLAASVCWRVLIFFKECGDLNHFPEHLLRSVDSALSIWQEFLLDKRPHPGACELHIIPLRGYVMERTDPKLPSNFNRYMARAIDIDVVCTKTEAFVYAKMMRVLLIGFIEMNDKDTWLTSLIHVNKGDLDTKRYKILPKLTAFIYNKARRAQEIHKTLSKKQWDRIARDYEKNTEKYKDSEMFKVITHDYVMFGDDAFDDGTS
jgi:hypothetical protein